MQIHNEGRAAFYRGIKATDSPYPPSALRSQWVKGWYDAQHDRCVTRAKADHAPPVMFYQSRLL